MVLQQAVKITALAEPMDAINLLFLIGLKIWSQLAEEVTSSIFELDLKMEENNTIKTQKN
jgi:hypothetical protein